jgi:hypothetical protein
MTSGCAAWSNCLAAFGSLPYGFRHTVHTIQPLHAPSHIKRAMGCHVPAGMAGQTDRQTDRQTDSVQTIIRLLW